MVFAGSALEEVELPPSVTELEPETFAECKCLARVLLPEGLECIGNRCFWKAGIRQITLPRTVQHIGEDAFGNTGLRTLSASGDNQ